jgi:predicted ester cyclase
MSYVRLCYRFGSIVSSGNEHLEVFTNASGDRVVSRWITRGANNGMFGLPADGALVEFSGIAIWRVENGRLAECRVERAALELHNRLLGRQ